MNLWKKHSHLFLISPEQGTQEWRVGTGAASHFWRMFSKEKSLLKLPCKQPSVGVLIFPSFLVWRDRTPHPGPFIYRNLNRNSCLFASVLISFSTTGQENIAHLPRIPIASYNHHLNIPGAVFPSVSFIFPVLTIIPLSKSNMTEIMFKKNQLSMLSCSTSCVLLKYKEHRKREFRNIMH